MNVFSLFEKHDGKYVISLGNFDGLHSGHMAVVDTAKKLAKDKNALVAMFTIRKTASGDRIYSYKEFTLKAKSLSIDAIIYANFDDGIYSLKKNEFLSLIFRNFDICGLVCGEDYTFGHLREGNVSDLEKFCEAADVDLRVCKLKTCGDEKISSSGIRKLLLAGDIKRANALLNGDYFLIGTVQKGRSEGKKLGFPTLNVAWSDEKLRLPPGVYKTTTYIDGKGYRSLTSVGDAPTFGVEEFKTETYVLGFNKDIYGQDVTICFDKYLRKLIKFDSAEHLVGQLKKDIETYD